MQPLYIRTVLMSRSNTGWVIYEVLGDKLNPDTYDSGLLKNRIQSYHFQVDVASLQSNLDIGDVRCGYR